MELTIDQALQQGIAAHKEGKVLYSKGSYSTIFTATCLEKNDTAKTL